MYLDSDNWLKASMEFENDQIQRLGSVVTNNGYSDWSLMHLLNQYGSDSAAEKMIFVLKILWTA